MNNADQDAIYSQQMMQYAQSVAAPHHLAHPDATGHAVSMICGSEVSIALTITPNDTVADFGYDIAACSLTRTAVAIVKNAIHGQNRAEIAEAGALLSKILDGNAEPESGVWATFTLLVPCRDYPARHQSILLVFDAIDQAFDQYEADKK